MDVSLTTLNLASNADLNTTLPVNDPSGAPVTMTGWPMKLQLKYDELDATVALEVTVTVTAPGILTLVAARANIAALFTGSTAKKRSLVGDLLTKPDNGAYVAMLTRIAATAVRGVSSL